MEQPTIHELMPRVMAEVGPIGKSLIQALCIPVKGLPDADAETFERAGRTQEPMASDDQLLAVESWFVDRSPEEMAAYAEWRKTNNVGSAKAKTLTAADVEKIEHYWFGGS